MSLGGEGKGEGERKKEKRKEKRGEAGHRLGMRKLWQGRRFGEVKEVKEVIARSAR
jgi:hypothetical protein